MNHESTFDFAIFLLLSAIYCACVILRENNVNMENICMEKQPLNCNHSAEECHWKPFTRDSLLRKRSIIKYRLLRLQMYFFSY